MIDPAGQKVKELPMILKAVDDNLFVNEQNFFEKYNAFDKDRDGYVSMNDVKKKMDELNFLNRAEIDKLVDYLDDEKKGFIDFKQFSCKVKRNMANNDPFCEEIHRNIMEPNHSQIKRLTRDQ